MTKGLIAIDGGECRAFDKTINSIEEKEKIGVVLADSGFRGAL